VCTPCPNVNAARLLISPRSAESTKYTSNASFPKTTTHFQIFQQFEFALQVSSAGAQFLGVAVYPEARNARWR